MKQHRGLLKGVARSFYLSLRVLPQTLEAPLSLAYLLARSLDTLADAPQLDLAQRQALVNEWIKNLAQFEPPALLERTLQEHSLGLEAEHRLLQQAPVLFDALKHLQPPLQAEVLKVLFTLSQAMQIDLQMEARGDDIAALTREEDTDHYTYCAAGCVGEFWTRVAELCLREFPRQNIEQLYELGQRYGKALQRVNILRDLAQDLRRRRYYLPEEHLAGLSLSARDLLHAENFARFCPLYREYVTRTERELSQCAPQYLALLPKKEFRLRLASALPYEIGKATLALLQNTNPLSSHQPLKISRTSVYQLFIQRAFQTLSPLELC